jgi:GT2 family glycosyltransferase
MNLGYSSANNIGIRRSIRCGAKYHVIMNPDVVFDASVIDELMCYAEENQDVVNIMPRVLSPSGEEQYLARLLPRPYDVFARRFLPNVASVKRNDYAYTLRNLDHRKVINAPVLSGCFMFLRVSTIKRYGLMFDERFFMYFEDYDFSRRLHMIGKTVYYPKCDVIHAHAKQSYHNWKLLLCHTKSAIQYFSKYGWIIDRERENMNLRCLMEHI